MITVILAVLLFLALAMLIHRSHILLGKTKDKKMFTIKSVPYFVLIGVMGLFFGLCVSITIGFCIPTKTVTITECNLKKIDSTCFVGQTSENKDSYYFFLQDCGENKINKMPSNEVKIVENDSVTPKVEYVIDEFVNQKNNLWAMSTNYKNVIITVPKGTIKVFPSIDLKDARYPDLLFWKNK